MKERENEEKKQSWLSLHNHDKSHELFLRLSGNTPVLRDLLMIFVKQGLIMSHIDFKILTGIVMRLLDLFFREQINF